MKFNLKKLVVALALAAAAGQASAAVVPASTGNGDLFLTAWDSSLNLSYSRDLGVDLTSFLANGMSASGLTSVFAGDALFTTTFANSSANNISWNIVAGDNVVNGTPNAAGSLRILSTSTVTPGTGFIFKNSSLQGATNNINNFQGYQVNDPLPAGTGCGTNPSCVITNSADPGFGGNTTWGSSLGGNGTISNVGTGFGSSLFFYYITGNGGNSLASSTLTAFANAAGNGTWTLASNGAATYAIPGVSAVPIPAAVWLFGSGLLGLVGIARRKRSA